VVVATLGSVMLAGAGPSSCSHETRRDAGWGRPSAREAREVPRLHVLVSGAELERPDRIARLMEAGGPRLAVQLRAPELDGRRLFQAASWLAARSRETGAPVLVNDRLDVALAAGTGGAHLKETSVEPDPARRILGDEALLGRSVHGVDAARELGRPPLDYLVLGPLFVTRSHPGRAPLSPQASAEAAAASRIPVLGIGGISPERAPALLADGLHGVVVFSGIWEAAHPREALFSYLQVLSGGAT